MVPDALPESPDAVGSRLRVAILGGLTWAFLCLAAGAIISVRTALLPVLSPDDLDSLRLAGLVAFAFGALFAGLLVDRIGGRILLSVAAFGAALAHGVAGVAVDRLIAAPAPLPFPPVAVLGVLWSVGLFLAGSAAVATLLLGSSACPERSRGGFVAGTGLLAAIGVFAAVPLGQAIVAGAASLSPDGAAAPQAPFLLAAALLVVVGILDLLALRGTDAPRAAPRPSLRALAARPASWMLAAAALCAGALLGGVVEGLPAFARGYWVLRPSSLAVLSAATVAAVLLGAVLAGLAARRFPGRPARAAAVLVGVAVLGTAGVLLTMGARPPIVGWADEEALPLRPGDVLLSVNGSPIHAGHSWAAVESGYRCMRSVCRGEGVLWDLARCECSRSPVQPAAAPIARLANIRFQVSRAGEVLNLKITDPLPYADAYQSRALPAGPELTVAPAVLGTSALLVALASFAAFLLMAAAAAPGLAGRGGEAPLAGTLLACATLGLALSSTLLAGMESRDWHDWPVSLIPFGIVGGLLLWWAGQKR